MRPHVQALTVALAKTGVTFFECVCPNVFEEVDAALSNVRIGGGGGGDGSDFIPCARTTRSDSDWGKARKWQCTSGGVVHPRLPHSALASTMAKNSTGALT